MTTKKLTKLLALYLPYILLGLVATNFGEAWRLAEGKELGERIMSMMGTIPVAFANPLPSLHPLDLLVGLCCGAGMRLAVYLRGKNAKKYRHGMEYGSARWGNAKDIEPFMAPKFSDNIILTKTERLMMSNRPPDPKNARNKNVLVVGGSGSGKTRFWLKPNLLQCHSSYVVTDPKGTIVLECGQAMLKNGYKVKVLNTINFKKSMHYNPFSYVHSEKDILKLVTTLMTNTKGEGSGGDPFWEKSERLLLTALIAYLHYEAPVEEQNFATLLEMLNTMQVMEDDEEYQNPVDLLFEDLAKTKPNSFAGRQYKLYKLAAGKTAKSILISCGARLAPFDIQELRDLTMYDELQLDTLGDKKTALFLIMSDTDSTFNFLISMVYTQLFNLLCDKADDVYGGKLPIHVRCLIDECANIGQILNIVDGSFFDDYDSSGKELQFKAAATMSVTYTLLERCGFEPEGYFDKDDFQAIHTFSTPDAVYALGAATSDISREVLRKIERTVKTTTRRRNVERMEEYEQQSELHEDRGLPAPEPDPQPAEDPAGQVRQAAPDLPEGAAPGAVPHDADEREPVSASDGGGADGREPDAADHGAASEAEPSPGQSAEPTDVGQPKIFAR